MSTTFRLREKSRPTGQERTQDDVSRDIGLLFHDVKKRVEKGPEVSGTGRTRRRAFRTSRTGEERPGMQ